MYFMKMVEDEDAIKCPECLQDCDQDELDCFGGMCEECFEEV